jgi:hypothetical protein
MSAVTTMTGYRRPYLLCAGVSDREDGRGGRGTHGRRPGSVAEVDGRELLREREHGGDDEQGQRHPARGEERGDHCGGVSSETREAGGGL